MIDNQDLPAAYKRMLELVNAQGETFRKMQDDTQPLIAIARQQADEMAQLKLGRDAQAKRVNDLMALLIECQQERDTAERENATLRALLQEVARFLDGEPYGVRNDDNDDAVDSYVEQCQEMIARIKKEVSNEA